MKGFLAAKSNGNASDKGAAISVSRLGILLALALILQLVEGMLPPLGFPGIKLGLANTVVLLALQLWGWKTALMVTFLRQIVGGLLTGKLLSVGFYLGLSGGLASILVMQLWMLLQDNNNDLVATSMAGALAHNWGQWAVARWLINHQAIIWYLPFLTLAALPCGLLVALLARPLISVFSEKKVSVSSITPKAFAVLLFLVFLGIGIPFYGMSTKEAGVIALVQVNGEIVKELELTQSGQWEMAAGNYSYIIGIEGGSLRVSQADCPDQVCVQTGLIKYQSQALVCVPGRMIITLENSKEEAELDGYLR